MDRLADSETSRARHREEAWSNLVAAGNDWNGRDAAAAFATFERALEKSAQYKEELSGSILRAGLDKEFATELCLNIVGKEGRAQYYIEKLKKYTIDNDTISTAGTIAIPSDADGAANVAGHHEPAEGSVGTAAMTDGHSNKRPHDTDTAPSQRDSPSKRPRRDVPRNVEYGSPASDTADAEDTQQDSRTGIRTILASDVEATDYIFPYPEIGPGHYVIRCDRHQHEGGSVHRFEHHPWANNRAVNHFKSARPASKCHKLEDGLVVDKEDIVKQFGYRVVDRGGQDVTRDWVAQSNTRLEAKKNPKAQKKPPAQATATATATATSNRRAGNTPIEYRDARRPAPTVPPPPPPPVTHTPSPSCVWAPEADMSLDTGANLLQEMGPDITLIVDQAAQLWVESQAVSSSAS